MKDAYEDGVYNLPELKKRLAVLDAEIRALVRMQEYVGAANARVEALTAELAGW